MKVIFYIFLSSFILTHVVIWNRNRHAVNEFVGADGVGGTDELKMDLWMEVWMEEWLSVNCG